MLRLVLVHTHDQPETPRGEDGPTAWLVDEKGNSVFGGHVVCDAEALGDAGALAGNVSARLRFVGSAIVRPTNL